MNKKKAAAIWVVALSIICGLITWHVVDWHLSGTYLEMSISIGTDRGYLTVLYNLGLMLIISTVLGLLSEKVNELLQS